MAALVLIPVQRPCAASAALICAFALSCGGGEQRPSRATKKAPEVPVRTADKDSEGEARGPEGEPLAPTTKAPPQPETKSVTKRRVADPKNPHARERARLDEELWAPEVAAQRHEKPFIALWDRLRGAAGRADPFAVAASFPFDQLKLGREGAVEDLGGGVTSSTTAAPEGAATLDQAGFRAWLDKRKREGWQLEQSEWHHSAFAPGDPATPPTSTFSILLHATRGATRLVVRGELKVTWATGATSEADAAAPPRPAMIDASGLTLTRRVGPPAFELGEVLDPPGERATPILARDLDGDGRSEILAIGGNTLYSSKDGARYEARPLVKLDSPVPMTAAALADFDGDHRLDLLTGWAGAGVKLLRGTAGGEFGGPPVNVALDDPMYSPSVITAGDVDGDGDLDAFVAQYMPPYRNGQMPTPYYDANDGFPSFLLINDGAGGFSDGTAAAGLAAKRKRRTYSSSLVDIDADNDLDLLVVSDFAGVDLYLNDGAGRFRDVTEERLPERASFGMAHSMADYDRDGALDLFVVGMSSTTARRLEQLGLGREEFARHQQMRMKMAYGNRLYLNDGKGHLRAASFETQVARSGWSWGAASFDADLDGLVDLYVANGNQSRGSAEDYCTTFWRHDIYDETSELDPELNAYFLDSFQDVIDRGVSWNGYEHNKLYMGRAALGPGFLELGFQLGVAFEDDSRSVIVDDVDLDGRPDLIVVFSRTRAGKVAGETQEERVQIVHNKWEHGHHWIGVRLVGPRSPIGAEVRVRGADDAVQPRRYMLGDSFQAQRAPSFVFGLGDASEVREIEVTWPDGHVEKIAQPDVDRYHEVRAGDGEGG